MAVSVAELTGSVGGMHCLVFISMYAWEAWVIFQQVDLGYMVTGLLGAY